jgi:ribosome-associated translation inhibitor RaiA
LYWQFSGIDQFEKLIRLHLTRQVQAWKSRTLAGKTTEPHGKVDGNLDRQSLDDDDEGILDLIEVFQDKFAELLDVMNRMAAATEELGAKITDRTAEIGALPRDAQENANPKDAKRLISKAAADMNQYTARIEAELPLFSDAMNSGMNSFIKAATMSIDLHNKADDVQQGLDAVIKLRGTLATSKQSTSEFRNTIASLPRMTTTLNKAKTRRNRRDWQASSGAYKKRCLIGGIREGYS